MNEGKRTERRKEKGKERRMEDGKKETKVGKMTEERNECKEGGKDEINDCMYE